MLKYFIFFFFNHRKSWQRGGGGHSLCEIVCICSHDKGMGFQNSVSINDMFFTTKGIEFL